MNKFKTAIDATINVILVIEGILTACFFVLVFANVILRFAHSSIIWAEQACRFMFAWATCLGIPVLMRRRVLVAFDLLYHTGSRVVKCIIDLLGDGVALVFAMWLIIYGFEYLGRSGTKIFEGIGLPYWVLYSVEPITGILIIVVVAEHLFKMFNKKYRLLTEGGKSV